MILTIDIGNTQTKIGVFRKANLVRYLLFPTVKTISHYHLRRFLEFYFPPTYWLPRLKGIALSCVVPALSSLYLWSLRKNFRCEPLLATEKEVPNLKILYQPPQSLGSDRLCNLVAGFQKWKTSLIIIDCGTATTIDLLRKDGTYLGGLIAPGILTAAYGLIQRTKLDLPSLRFPLKIIGRCTACGLRSGILYGPTTMLEGLVKKIEKESGLKAQIIITGGLAPLLKPHLPSAWHHEPFLTLEGLNYLWQQKNLKKV